MVELVKFVLLYFLFDIGFTLAFFTLLNGTSHLVPSAIPVALDVSAFEIPDPFSSIGYGMIQVIR